MKAITRPTGSWPYVLRDDRQLPPPDQSRFILTPLSAGERAAFVDNLMITRITPEGREVMRRERQETLRLCLSHISEVQNFPAGAPQPWPEKPEDRAKYLEMLPDDCILEIGDAIYARSSLLGTSDGAVSPTLPPVGTSNSDATLAASTSTTAPSVNAIPA